MTKEKRPLLQPVGAGSLFKVIQVTGQAGMEMPPHHSTKEAVLVILEGLAALTISGKELILKKGDTFILPAGEMHSLKIDSGFSGIVILEKDAAIQFGDQQT